MDFLELIKIIENEIVIYAKQYGKTSYNIVFRYISYKRLYEVTFSSIPNKEWQMGINIIEELKQHLENKRFKVKYRKPSWLSIEKDIFFNIYY